MLRDFDPDGQAAVRELVLDGLRERWGGAFDASVNPDLDGGSERSGTIAWQRCGARIAATGGGD